MLVDDADLARRDDGMVSDDLAGERLNHLHLAAGDDQQHGHADKPVRDTLWIIPCGTTTPATSGIQHREQSG